MKRISFTIVGILSLLETFLQIPTHNIYMALMALSTEKFSLINLTHGIKKYALKMVKKKIEKQKL